MTASDDVHSLTGAYVLDAVPTGEQDMFERHLADCPECQREIREMREAVVTMAGAAAYPPAPAMRERALARIGSCDVPPGGLVWRGRLRQVMLVAAVLAVLVLAVLIAGAVLG